MIAANAPVIDDALVARLMERFPAFSPWMLRAPPDEGGLTYGQVGALLDRLGEEPEPTPVYTPGM